MRAGRTAPGDSLRNATVAVARRKLRATILVGEGSTFQLNYTQAVISSFKEQEPRVTIRYVAVGSLQGIKDLANHRIDLAGIDGRPPPEVMPELGDGALLYFPIAVAPIAVVFKLGTITTLQLSPPTIAAIFQGEVTSWDAPAIKAENPEVTLPHFPITVVHRADGSGTTRNFTGYLSQAAPLTWTRGSGWTVSWPPASQGAAGNWGVARIVKATPGAIGYIDYADALALHLATASVENASGAYVAPSAESTLAALETTLPRDDLIVDPIDATGPAVYPISIATGLLVYREQPDVRRAAALKAFLRYIYSKGQELTTELGSYVAVPAAVVNLARAAIPQIVVRQP